MTACVLQPTLDKQSSARQRTSCLRNPAGRRSRSSSRRQKWRVVRRARIYPPAHYQRTGSLHTGARAGEQITVEWGDVDFANRKVIFRAGDGDEEPGPRTELDMRRQLDLEVAQERLTAIDRRLAALASTGGTIRMADIASAADAHKISRSQGRLDVLEKMQLVERVAPTSWRFENGSQQTLKDLGERGDIVKRIHHALEDGTAEHRVFQPEPGAAVEGVGRDVGRAAQLRRNQDAHAGPPRGDSQPNPGRRAPGPLGHRPRLQPCPTRDGTRRRRSRGRAKPGQLRQRARVDPKCMAGVVHAASRTRPNARRTPLSAPLPQASHPATSAR